MRFSIISITLLACGIFAAPAQERNEITVDTTDGQVRGREQLTLFNRKPYMAFKGIPFGKPPIGELRFKPPQRSEPWNGTLDAFEFANECVQPGTSGHEDCLYLNVFSTNVTPSGNLPVLFAIHGGSFETGSGEQLGPDFLINQEDIVMVTMNYRLGPLGFMTLRTPEYSGNMGLKDVLLALKWVHENIHNFGGDPSRITLYGISAGSAIAHMLVVSPVADGLFQRAIMASGTGLNPWAISNSEHLYHLFPFAYANGVYPENLNQMTNFLREVDPHLLTNSLRISTPITRLDSDLVWSPVVEPPGTIDPFLSESPFDILQNNFSSNVDTMFGYNSAESYLFINDLLRDPSLLAPFDDTFEITLPIPHMNRDLNFQSEEFRSMSDEVRNFYFGDHDGRVYSESRWEFTQVVSDITFNYGVDFTAKLHGEHSTGQTFFYRFSVEGIFNIMRLSTYAPTLGFPGATHADDVFYVFATEGLLSFLYNLVPAGSMERRIINQFSKMYTDFMVHGDPLASDENLTFEAVTADELNFIDITNSGLIAGVNPNGEITHFWDNLMEQYGFW